MRHARHGSAVVATGGSRDAQTYRQCRGPTDVHTARLSLKARWIPPAERSGSRRLALLRTDLLIRVSQQIDLVGVTDAQRLLVVNDADVLTGFDRVHLIGRLSVGRKDLVELRHDQKTQGLFGLGVLYLDVV